MIKTAATRYCFAIKANWVLRLTKQVYVLEKLL